MPTTERSKKAAAKSLARAAAQPGQSQITSMFVRTNIEENNIVEENTSVEETQMTVNDKFDNVAGVQETWIKTVNDFTSEDKKNSEKNGRYFVREWLERHEWLSYNREKRKAFCSTCTSNSDTQKGVFNFRFAEGFDNWKKGAEKFKEHEESFVHKAACVVAARESRSIRETFTSLQFEKQQLRKQGLIAHLQTMKTLLRQGVAIRGNADKERIYISLIVTKRPMTRVWSYY